MVIPDAIKQQLLYHYPNAKFKVSHGLFYAEELKLLGKCQFFYGVMDKHNALVINILHQDKTIRTITGDHIDRTQPLLIKSLAQDSGSYDHVGYLIEIT